MKRKQFVVALAFLLVPSLMWAQVSTNEGDPEDFGTGTGGAPEAITPIACPGATLIELDFDLMPGGPTTAGAIQAAFPAAGLGNITLTPPTAPAGVFNTNPIGRALAADPAGGLGLFLVDPPAGAFGAFDQMIVDFVGPASEFGFQIGDWNGPINIEIFDGAASVGTAQFSTGGAPATCFSSDLPFDQVVMTLNPDNPGGNWVVVTLWIADIGVVPTMPGPALAVLVALLLGVSVLLLVRRRSA